MGVGSDLVLVGDHDESAPFLRCELVEEGQDVGGAAAVQGPRRLVREEQDGVGDDGASHSDALLLQKLGLDKDPEFARQRDPAAWPALKARLAALFRTQPAAHWCALFENTDVCFAPVLTTTEAAAHPHNAARATFFESEGVVQPSPAPRFSRTPAARPGPASFIGEHDELTTDVVDTDAYQQDRKAVPATEKSRGKQEFVNCGKSFAKHEVGVFDDAGKRLGDRSIGEIWVRGPSVAKGYYEDDVATERTFGNGWLKTGDYGYLVDGNVFITGRKKDIIIINGRNYDPQRLEWICDEIPEIRKGSTVAFSRPGATSEELVIAVESRAENKEALIELIKQRINEEMQLTPADVAIAAVGSLPKTSSGKLRRSTSVSLVT